MDTPYRGSRDVHVLPTHATLPGVGVLTINAYVLMAEQPVLIDTGLGVDRGDFVDALQSVIDPRELRWVWLTHDDADHTGNIERVMQLAPDAKLATAAFSALRMATWWRVPMDRVHAIRPGSQLDVGDRTLTAVAPPLYDNPLSTGLVDGSTGAFFCVDAFGAILPEPAGNVAEVPPDVLAGGMLGWATSDSPWAHLVDRQRYGQVLDSVRRLQPTHIYSSHLPAATGVSLESFLKTLEAVPDAEPFLPPDHEAFGQMIAAMNEAQQQPAAAT